jgi:4-alpha-glucanotransferase
VRFDREWRALRAYAAERGVRLIGDVPIYVAPDSADHLTHPGLFQRGVVAGAPPDPLGPEGQLWGNPLYDWQAMAEDGYRWWIDRLRRTFTLHDLSRLDHFRGFAQYWAVPDGAASAVEGEWRDGPRAAVFRAAEAELGPLPVIAEDLGVITPDVVALREELGFPGMVVLQFAFDWFPDNPHKPQNHREDSVVYTGTHDTDTARGWWDALSDEERSRTGLAAAEPHWSLIELAYSSPARLAIVQAQDVLGLGSEARMNTPGRDWGNWHWRLEPGQLTREHALRLRGAAERYAR